MRQASSISLRYAGPHHEVVGVGENGATVPFLEAIELHPFHRTPRSYRQETGSLDLAVSRGQNSPPRRGGGIAGENLKGGHISVRSPKCEVLSLGPDRPRRPEV